MMKWKNILSPNSPASRRLREGGNALTMIFMAIGMAGVVTYGLNNVMRGPAVTAAETSRRTIAENNLVATTRMAIAAAAKQQTNNGDCDQDGFVEPMPFRAAGPAIPSPLGGGLLPMTIGATTTDPWGNQYGYCVWDPGTVSKGDAFAGCGGAGANRLEGAPNDDQPAIAVISAGRNGTFQTTCNAYLDAPPEDGKPDTPMVAKAPAGDDIVLTYTYAEANGVGGGLWKISQDPLKPNTAEIGMGIESTSAGGATFGGKVELKNKGLVLPGDPGDNTVTGACDEAKDGQIRRNIATSPPTLEMCDFTNGGGWTQISGGATADIFNPKVGNCTANEGGPFVIAANSTIVGSPASLRSALGRAGSQTLFVGGSNGAGIHALSFNGAGFTEKSELSGVYGAIDFDPKRNIIYTVGGLVQQLDAFGWDGSTLTHLGRYDTADHILSVYVGADGTIFTTEADGNAAYTFNGSAFTRIYKGTGEDYNLWMNTDTVFYGGNAARIMRWNGATMTAATPPGFPAFGVWGDAQYIYYSARSWGYTGTGAYTFDGTTLTEVDKWDDHGGSVWADGTHVYVIDDDKVAALKFDGTEFTQVSEVTLPDMPASPSGAAIWGDGNYIYVGIGAFGAGDGRLYALGGFGCTSPNVPGGYVKPANVAVSGAKKYLVEPLDMGLVSHWKMDEVSGNIITDSVGANSGELLNDAVRAAGQNGSGAVQLNGETVDAIRIPGLLGKPSALTIAGWINVTAPDYGGAEVFSIGDNVLLRYGTDGTLYFLYYDGGSYPTVTAAPGDVGPGWHYVVGVIDIDGTDDTMSLYVDGRAVAKGTIATAIAWTAAGTDTYIGRNGQGGPAYDMTGMVDDFRFYARALSPAEASQLSQKNMLEGKASAPLTAYTQTGDMTGRISVSEKYSCAIKSDGSLWCWGLDGANQTLGDGAGGVYQPQPVQVKEPDTQVFYPYYTTPMTDFGYGSTLPNITNAYMLPYMTTTGSRSVSFSAAAPSFSFSMYNNSPGYPHQLPVGVQDYKIIVNFNNAAASCLQLTGTVERQDNGTTVQATIPLTVDPLESSGGRFVLKGSGDVGAYAYNDRLRPAFTATKPTTCPDMVDMSMTYEFHVPRTEHATWTWVGAGDTHACGVKSDGTAWCWGADTDGMLGNSARTSTVMAEPSRVYQNASPFTQVSAGATHTCAIQTSGMGFCWGSDAIGQLGNTAADVTPKHEPSPINYGLVYSDITTGGLFSCGVSRGQGYCWGSDDFGQLGNGAPVATSIMPAALAEAGPWVKIRAGREHACGIKQDGTLWCWGNGSSYQLGIDADKLLAPVKTSQPNGWVDIAAGSNFTCGIHRDGNAYCWGAFENGRLGNPAVAAATYVPVKVLGSEGAAAIAAGGNHACAMKADGSVLCWGDDSAGQIGNGATLSAAPSLVAGFPGLPGWSWNDAADIIMSPPNLNLGLNGGIMGIETIDPTVKKGVRGFGFTDYGRAVITQLSEPNQLLIDAGDHSSPQVTFSSTGTYGGLGDISGVTARWGVDSLSGTTVASIPAGSAGNTFGAMEWNPYRGRVGGSLIFDGVDDQVRFTNQPWNRPTSFTLAAWIRPASKQGADAKIITKNYDSYVAPNYNTFALSVSTSGQWLTFETAHSDNTLYEMTGSVPLMPEAWNYVVATFDASKNPPKRLFINGEEATTTTGTSSLPLNYNTSFNSYLYWGTNNVTSDSYYKGELDEVRLYPRALSPAEANQLYDHNIALGAIGRSLGVNENYGALVVGVNQTLSTPVANISEQFSISSKSGDVLIGTLKSGDAGAKLDVVGGVRFGRESLCNTGKTGAIRYDEPTQTWTYCDGTAWKSFKTAVSLPWKSLPTFAGSAFGGHTCGLRANGAAYCWGRASNGALGMGSNGFPSPVPLQVKDNTATTSWADWKQITIGSDHSCGVRTDGSAWCWGHGGGGRLGDGNLSIQAAPVRVQTDTGTTGWNDWTQLSAGNQHTCGVRVDGSAWCWGRNSSASIGNGTTATSQPLPARVVTDSGGTGWNDWTQITAGGSHTCGLRADGSAWCWGPYTATGTGCSSVCGNITRPAQVHTDTGPGGWSDWTYIHAGNNNTCGIRVDGSAWCWGQNIKGKLGNGNSSTAIRPVRVDTDTGSPGWSDWRTISAGANHTCGVRTNGTAWCWGAGANYPQGNGTTTDNSRPTRVLGQGTDPAYSDWIDIFAANDYSCGRRLGGTIWCWGANGSGQLGNNTTVTQQRPAQVVDP